MMDRGTAREKMQKQCRVSELEWEKCKSSVVCQNWNGKNAKAVSCVRIGMGKMLNSPTCYLTFPPETIKSDRKSCEHEVKCEGIHCSETLVKAPRKVLKLNDSGIDRELFERERFCSQMCRECELKGEMWEETPIIEKVSEHHIFQIRCHGKEATLLMQLGLRKVPSIGTLVLVLALASISKSSNL
jgi:hypothetical protein